MKNIQYLILIFAVLGTSSCIKEIDTEKEQPKIELLGPLSCDTLYFGEKFKYKVKLTDNTGLGNISMDLHNNFGHHDHGSHASCNFDPVKTAANPYSESWIFTLPTEKKEYIFETEIGLPAMKNENALYDSGDYHFHIYVTDNDGYQIFTSLDVKIINRK